MDAILKALVYLLAGLALLTINLWFARAVWNAIAEPAPVVIAPFEVVGRDDAGGKLGTALATMLLARLGRIREEMNASALELRAVRQREDDRRDPAIQTLDADVRRPEIPERLFAPLDLTMTVGGVEVGGMITWLHRALARDNLLHVAVHYDGDRAVAVAHVGGRSEHLLWLQTRGANDEVVSDIAYALTHREFARHTPEVEVLEAGEFKTLMSTLHRLAEVNRQATRGRAAPAAYAELLPHLEGLVDKAPDWRDLARLTATVAESGGDVARAVAVYGRELELTAEGDPARAIIGERIARLTQRLAATTPAAADVPGPPAPGRPPEPPPYPLNLLGVDTVEMARSPLVAVVGGVPPAPLDERYQVLADLAAQTAVQAAAQPTYDLMGEYTLTLVQAVRLVAPEAHFLFAPVRAPRGATTMPELLRALERAIDERPEILLLTLGPLEGPEFVPLFERAVHERVLVVIAAGNEPARPAPFADHPLGKSLMVVAATDAEGAQAKFTQRARDVFWAPGEKVPVAPHAGKPDARAGTAYAAALAAGVAARILDAHPQLELQRLLETVRETSQPVKSGGPRILNLHGALSRLAA